MVTGKQRESTDKDTVHHSQKQHAIPISSLLASVPTRIVFLSARYYIEGIDIKACYLSYIDAHTQSMVVYYEVLTATIKNHSLCDL